MEIKHLKLEGVVYSYAVTFVTISELQVVFYENGEKIKTVSAAIVSYSRETGFLSFRLLGKIFDVVVSPAPQGVLVQTKDAHVPVVCQRVHTLAADSAVNIRGEGPHSEQLLDLFSPLSGRVVQVLVKPGDVVSASAPLVIIESMKMENVLYASRDAVIKTVFIAPGDLVKQSQKLIGFKRAGEVYGACQAAGDF